MKKLLIAASLTLVSGLAFAGEPMQIAAAIGSGATTTTAVGTMDEAASGAAAGNGMAGAAAGGATANMIGVGIIVASGIAAASGSTATTASH